MKKNYKSLGVRRCLQTIRIIPTKHINPATGHAYVTCTPHKALARAGSVATMSYHVPLGFLDLLLEPGVLAPVVNRHADLPDTQRQQPQ